MIIIYIRFMVLINKEKNIKIFKKKKLLKILCIAFAYQHHYVNMIKIRILTSYILLW